MTLRRRNIRTQVEQETDEAATEAAQALTPMPPTAPGEQSTLTTEPVQTVHVRVEPAAVPSQPEPEKTPPSREPIPSPQAPTSVPLSTSLPYQQRRRYPRGESFKSVWDYFPTHVLAGMRELVEELSDRTGYNKSELSTVAFILLLEDYGYDMTEYKHKLPSYFYVKELEAQLKKREQEPKKAAKKKEPQQ